MSKTGMTEFTLILERIEELKNDIEQLQESISGGIDVQLTFKQTCKILNISDSTLRLYIKQGKIEHLKDGKNIFFLPEHIMNYRKSITRSVGNERSV